MTNAPHVQSGETPDQALPRYFAWLDAKLDHLDKEVSIFREYGWDWTYHAFREWPGWSVEHEPVKYGVADDCFKPSADNPRKRALIEGLVGNLL